MFFKMMKKLIAAGFRFGETSKNGVPEIVEIDYSFNTYAKFFEELTFLTPWYAHIRVRIRG